MKKSYRMYTMTVHRPFILVGLVLIIFTLASCSESSTAVEEEEENMNVDQELVMTQRSGTINEGNARFVRYATTDIGALHLLARTTVNVSAAGETKQAAARGYANFEAQRENATLLADISWKGTLLSAVNLSARSQMTVTLRVRERNSNGTNGPVVFSEELESDGIGSGLRVLQVLNVDDSVRDRFNVRLTPGQILRVEVELECFLRVDVISFTAVDCNAESDGRGVFVNQLKILY